ncbi:response regulator [Desulfococcaceae bacterium HSG8]|nr:response regulator [Desulfococcaceae bacterium HSG8]
MNSENNIILVIDDNANNIRVIVGYLKEAGFEIAVARNSTTGLKRAELLKPALILLDILMPGTDGFETCRRLKANDATKDIPVIFMTALMNIEDKVRAFECGGVDYIIKPIQREEVLVRVSTHLRIRKQTAELEAARLTADQANRAKSRFLANMSHEIRTPLNAILGFSEILFSRASDSQEKNYLSSILSSGQTLLSLINDVLDLSKIEAGKVELQYKPLSIRSILHDILQIFLQKAEQKGIGFRTGAAPDIPDVLVADEMRIRQILMNLAGNALKFTSQGSISVSASGDFADKDESRFDLILEVRDTGIGIPAGQQELIFESFRQQEGQDAEEYGGTGLGLTITKRLVEMMNGSISVESEPGEGSLFRVIFYGLEVAELTDIDVKSSGSDDVFVEFEPATLLVADDVRSNRELIRGYLKDTNISVIEAKSGEHALAMLQNIPASECPVRPDLVLADLRMPGRNGYEMTEIIKSSEELQYIPVIAFTAHAMKEEQDRITSLFDGYLRKPVKRAELISELKRFLSVVSCQSSAATGQSSVATGNGQRTTDYGQLTDVLESEALPRWEELREAYFIDDIIDFAEKLGQITSEYGVDFLTCYSENLYKFAQSNQIDEIDRLMAEFPEIVDKVRGITNK